MSTETFREDRNFNEEMSKTNNEGMKNWRPLVHPLFRQKPVKAEELG